MEWLPQWDAPRGGCAFRAVQVFGVNGDLRARHEQTQV
jgi:hypothetical protein